MRLSSFEQQRYDRFKKLYDKHGLSGLYGNEIKEFDALQAKLASEELPEPKKRDPEKDRYFKLVRKGDRKADQQQGKIRQVVDPADAELAIQRMAGNRVVEEAPVDVLDSLVQDAKDEAAVASLLDDAFEYLELKRQRDSLDQIHGASEAAAFLDPNNPSQTTEQQIGRQLVMSGIEPAFIPADRILGRDVSVNQSGIDGRFKDDSEVRRHVTGSFEGDDLELDRSDIYTEFMSPTAREQAFEEWKPTARANQRNRQTFNRAVSEYYGQQALRLRGATPVADNQRSYAVQKADRQGDVTTVGSDRLIENSRALTDKDTKESADFRYIDSKGNVVVGDNQAGNLTPDNIVNFNLLKNSNIDLRDYGADNFKARLAQEAQELKAAGLPYTLDDIFGSLMDKGELAPLGMAMKDGGTRAGKVLSGQPIMGAENFDDQHRYEKLLYPMQERGAVYQDEGYLPDKFRMFDTTSASATIGEMLANPNTDPANLNFFQQGKKLNVALKTIPSNSAGYLKDDSLNRQFSEGYGFGRKAGEQIRAVIPQATASAPTPASVPDLQLDVDSQTAKQRRHEENQARLRERFGGPPKRVETPQERVKRQLAEERAAETTRLIAMTPEEIEKAERENAKFYEAMVGMDENQREAFRRLYLIGRGGDL